MDSLGKIRQTWAGYPRWQKGGERKRQYDERTWGMASWAEVRLESAPKARSKSTGAPKALAALIELFVFRRKWFIQTKTSDLFLICDVLKAFDNYQPHER